MKKLLVLLVLLAGGFAGLAYLRGWFVVTTTGQTGAEGSSNGSPSSVTVTIDKEKIRDDKAKAAAAVEQAKQKAVEGAHAVKEKAGDAVQSGR